MPSTADPSNDRNPQPSRRRKPDWAKQAVSLFGDSQLARDVAASHSTSIAATIANEAAAFLMVDVATKDQETHRHDAPVWALEECPTWCVGFHKDDGERTHRGRAQGVCSLTEPRFTDHDALPGTFAELILPTGRRAPGVRMTVWTAAGSRWIDLTMSEALELGRVLMRAAHACEQTEIVDITQRIVTFGHEPK